MPLNILSDYLNQVETAIIHCQEVISSQKPDLVQVLKEATDLFL